MQAVTGPACGSNVLADPLGTTGLGNIQVTNTLVEASKTCCQVQVMNPSLRELWFNLRFETIHGAV